MNAKDKAELVALVLATLDAREAALAPTTPAPAKAEVSPVLKKDVRKALRVAAGVTPLHTLHPREGQPYASASERKAFVAQAKAAGYGDVEWVKSIAVK